MKRYAIYLLASALLLAWLWKRSKPMTRAEFKAKFLYNTEGLDTAGMPVLFLLAVAAYESGDGNGRYAKEANNIFSITAGTTWKGPTLKNLTGTYTFRVYGSWRESVQDFVRLMTRLKRYDKALAAARAGNLAAFAAELQAAGYGDPGKTTYGAELVARSNAYKGIV